MINAKKVLATFAVLLTLGGTVSSLASVQTSNVTAHAAKKHAKKHVKKVNHKTSKDTFYHAGFIFDLYSGGYSLFTPIGDPGAYMVDFPSNKYYRHPEWKPKVQPTYLSLAKAVKSTRAKLARQDPFIYDKKGLNKFLRDDLLDKVLQVSNYGIFINKLQTKMVPLLKPHMNKEDYQKLSSIRNKIMKNINNPKHRDIVNIADKAYRYPVSYKPRKLNSHDKKMYKELRSNWALNKEYLQVLAKVFGYLKY